jgi:hypothetical protein
MNYPIFAAGVLTSLAFVAHTIIGNKEALSTTPAKLGDPAAVSNFAVIERNWAQSLCAFQLVTIDLVVLSALLFLLAVTDYIGPKRQVAMAVSLFYALWGGVWFIQLCLLKRPVRDFLVLSQWLFWFMCAGLVYWGAQAL